MKVSNSSERLKELINVLNINQKDICDRTGLNRSAVSMYVNGQREPRQDKISQIADAYNIDPAWLMGYEVPMKRIMRDISDLGFESSVDVRLTDMEEVELISRYRNADDLTKQMIKKLLGIM